MSSGSKYDFGNFGNTRPVKQSPSVLRRILFWLFLFVVAIVVPLAFSGWREVYLSFLEKDPPQILTPNLPSGVSAEGMEMKIEVKDPGSGVDEVVVRGEQNGEIKELLREQYKEKRHIVALTLKLPGKESGYEEGTVAISISAFDRSFWTNPSNVTLALKVDYSKPKIEVITTQHNAVLGGSEFVFYRLLDADPNIFSGIKAGEWLFPGFPAKNLDPDFQGNPDVYFSFFPIPREFDVDRDKIRLFARDAVGNISTAGINYNVQRVKYPTRELKLSENFVRDKVEDLLPRYYALDAKVSGRKPSIEIREPNTTDDLLARFKIVNEDFRVLVERLLQPLFARPKASKLWDGLFTRQGGAAQEAGFGEARSYLFNGTNVGQSIHYGVDLASTANTVVRAANGGIVIFADDLGLYGNTVILDHGFGLSTLYGHLSSIRVSEGDSVVTGSELGRSGNSGFAEGDHLHFEIRLHGIPVRPVEWWDQKWIRDHIQAKIELTKEILGIRLGKPIT